VTAAASAPAPAAPAAPSAPTAADRRRSDGGTRVRLGWSVGLLLIAALEFTACYQGALSPVVFVPAVILPFAIVFAGGLLGGGSFLPALVSIVVSGALGWFALRDSSGPLGGVGDAVPRLLTTPRPAPAEAALLAPPAVFVALVSALVAACVLVPSGRTAGRVAGLLAPVVGCAAVYTAAQLLSAGAADRHGIVAACLLVVVVGGWSTPVLRGGPMKVALRPAAVGPLVAALVIGLGVAYVVPSGAYDPRRHVTPPTVKLTAASPLGQFGSWQANPTVEIFRVHATGTNRLHLATLSRFTGAAWEVDDHYREVGLAASADLPDGQRRGATAATVQLTRLGGIWLPANGVPTSTTLDGAVVDADDGTLAHTGGVRAGTTYDVHGELDAPTAGQLQAASVPTATPAEYLALPGGPSGFLQYAREAVRGASTPLEEAVAIEHAVSTGRTLSSKAPSGSSYGRLETFLFGKAGGNGAQVGTAEQFAAGFAVLAREVGLPTRLVVGFEVPDPNVNGTSVVHGSDATVWPEVYFRGAGWVPFAPTPGAGDSGTEGSLRDSVLQRLSEKASAAPIVPPPASGSRTAAPTPHPSGSAAAAASADHGPSTGTLVGAVVVVVLLALLLLLVGLRRLRAARHRRQGARGAWAEFLDLLVLIGRRPARSQPAPALAAAFDADFPHTGSVASRLADAADREAFAPAPGAATAEVWRDLRVLRRRAKGTLPVHRRVLLPLDPRPLLRRR
jgi:hypothetical protein